MHLSAIPIIMDEGGGGMSCGETGAPVDGRSSTPFPDTFGGDDVPSHLPLASGATTPSAGVWCTESGAPAVPDVPMPRGDVSVLFATDRAFRMELLLVTDKARGASSSSSFFPFLPSQVHEPRISIGSGQGGGNTSPRACTLKVLFPQEVWMVNVNVEMADDVASPRVGPADGADAPRPFVVTDLETFRAPVRVDWKQERRERVIVFPPHGFGRPTLPMCQHRLGGPGLHWDVTTREFFVV